MLIPSILLATAFARAPGDPVPLARAGALGEQLASIEAPTELAELDRFMAEAGFTVEVGAGCDGTPQAGALRVEADDKVAVVVERAAEAGSEVWPHLVWYGEDGAVRITTLEELTYRPGERVGRCFPVRQRSVVFAVGTPPGVHLEQHLERLSQVERFTRDGDVIRQARRIEEALRTEARERVAVAQLGALQGRAPSPTEALVHVGSPEQDPLAGILRHSFLETFPAGTGVLVYTEAAGGMEVAWYPSRGEIERAALPVDAATLGGLVDDLRAALGRRSDAAPRPKAAAKALVKAVLPRRIRAGVAEAAHLVVVPAGAVGQIPWLALAPKGKPLATSTAVTVVTDLRSLVTVPPEWSAPRAALVVGEPTSALPGAAAEARAVADAMSAAALTGDAASRSTVLSRVTTADALYLATRCTGGDPGAAIELAEGVWTASELRRTDLSGVGLAVLSGCDAPLAGALHEAGVPRVVQALWRPEGDGPAQLAVALAEELRSAPPSEALRRAAARLRDDKVEPHVWASFMAYGTPR